MKLTIEKAVFGGMGLARMEGKAIFVPLVLPGETVQVHIARDRSSFAEAEVVSILDPAPWRVAAPCPYYGACGGCQYQHADYATQLALKQSILTETLTRAGLTALPAIATHSAEPWRYRNRIRLHVDPRTHALGYLRRASHTLLSVETCPIAAPMLEKALAALHPLFAQQRSGAWCAAVTLFTNETGDALLLTCELRPGAAFRQQQLDRLCIALAEQLPLLGGAALIAAASRLRSQRQPQPRKLAVDENEAPPGAIAAAWGAPALAYRVAGRSFRVSHGAFFQGNRFLVDTLLALATADEHGHAAWDLFAGGGLFTSALTERFAQVTAVEGAPVSAADLAHNMPGATIRQTSAHAFLASGQKSPAPSLILLDPPRAGLGLDASRDLAAIRSPSITYVSCDPATLARDLRVLVDAGYTINRLDLVDMFPQTAHLETVARLHLR